MHGNFVIIFGLFVAQFSAPSNVCYALRSLHADWRLMGCLGPVWGFGLVLDQPADLQERRHLPIDHRLHRGAHQDDPHNGSTFFVDDEEAAGPSDTSRRPFLRRRPLGQGNLGPGSELEKIDSVAGHARTRLPVIAVSLSRSQHARD